MRVLVTGGLGLVGVNYAARCLDRGDQVVVLDSHARGGSNQLNERWLQSKAKNDQLMCIAGSVEEPEDVVVALRTWGSVDRVLHAAAQVSIETSMENPGRDFLWNTVGTFNVLESVRRHAPETSLIMITSNKVYDIAAWPVEIRGKGYRWVGRPVGPSEEFPFYTGAKEPYGASKISGLYYTRAYAKLYGLNYVIAVPSGMYGPRQYGKAEQGWLGWFAIATALGIPIDIRGNGFQVRDMLHVTDVCDAFDLLFDLAPKYRGELFNLGGGVRNAVSLLEAIDMIQEVLNITPTVGFSPERRMDDKVFITNIERMVGLGWCPRVDIKNGIEDVCRWINENKEELETLYTKEVRHAA